MVDRDKRKAIEMSLFFIGAANQVSTFEKEIFFDIPLDIRTLKAEVPKEYVEQFDEAVIAFKETMSKIAVQLVDDLS